MVYCAETLSLAALESFVHFDSSLLPDDYAWIAVEIPAGVAVEELSPARLPANWRDNPARDSVRTVGSDWAASGRTAVLSVPSAIVEQERNFLLNPDHPQFKKIRARKPRPFRFDERMSKTSLPVPPKTTAKPKRQAAKVKRKAPVKKRRAPSKRR
jgi:RES domain-containing protein